MPMSNRLGGAGLAVGAGGPPERGGGGRFRQPGGFHPDRGRFCPREPVPRGDLGQSTEAGLGREGGARHCGVG